MANATIFIKKLTPQAPNTPIAGTAPTTPPGVLCQLDVVNLDQQNGGYIFLTDATSAPTAGTTAPLAVFPILPGQAWSRNFNTGASAVASTPTGIPIATGFCVNMSTNPAVYTPPPAGMLGFLSQMLVSG